MKESIDPTPTPARDEVRTISLAGDTPVLVPNSTLMVKISGSFHKIRAPLVGVSILVSRGGDKAEVEWRIESDQIDSEWRGIRGRRWDADSNAYVEEEIPGWLVRLDSVDENSAGGDPTAITISLKQDTPAAGSEVEKIYELPIYPGATRFCDGHVTGAPGSGHISWTTFQSSDQPERVVEYYVGALGADNRDHSDEGDTWRFPVEQPTRVLSIHEAGASGPWNQCDLPGGARTILSFSTMAR